MIKVLVADDHAIVRRGLRQILAETEDIMVGGEAATAQEVLQLVRGERRNAVILDISLPGLSGLEATKVIAALPAPPFVVFVTADDSRAVDAFELAAVDYVVKPVSGERLARTVERLRAFAGTAPAVRNGTAPPSRVALDDGERVRLVKVSEIRYVQANGHIVTARVFDGDLRWKGSLADAAARLEPAGFLRVHRAYLVNPERVVEVEPFFGGSYLLRVDDKARSEVPISRNFLPAVRRTLGL